MAYHLSPDQNRLNYKMHQQFIAKPKHPAGTILEDGTRVVCYRSHSGRNSSYRVLEEIEKIDPMGKPISLVRLGFLKIKPGQTNDGFVVERSKVDFGSSTES